MHMQAARLHGEAANQKGKVAPYLCLQQHSIKLLNLLRRQVAAQVAHKLLKPLAGPAASTGPTDAGAGNLSQNRKV